MPDKKETPESKPVAKKPTKKRKRSQYGAGKMKAAEEILEHAKALVELRTASSSFPGLKVVFDKEIVRRKAAIKSRLERA